MISSNGSFGPSDPRNTQPDEDKVAMSYIVVAYTLF